MLRYKISPRLQEEEGRVCLGCTSRSLGTVTYANLGRLAEQGGRPQIILGFEREIVTGIFGQRGSGKSYTLGTIIEALGARDAEANIGVNIGDRAVLLFDTLNIYQYGDVPVSQIPNETLRSQLSEKLSSFSVAETEIAIETYYPAGREQSFYSERYHSFALDTSLIRPEDYAHIFEIDLFREPLGHLLLAAYDGTKSSGYIFQSTRREGSDQAGLTELIDFLSDNDNTDGSFDPNSVRALRSRLISLARDPIFSGRPTRVASMLQPGTVTVLLLSHLSPPMRSLVAGILIRQLFNARAAASEANKTLQLNNRLSDEERSKAERTVLSSPPRTLICIDEAQGYAPPSKTNPCTSVLIQYVKEGRNHGLSLMITSQQPSAIHSEVLSQVDCVIAHRLTVQPDIEAVLRSAKGRAPKKISSGAQVLSTNELIRELDRGQVYISHGDTMRAFVAEIRPRVTAHGGIEG